MKRSEGAIFWVAAILCAVLVCSLIPTEAEAAIYSDTVRLHIRARSDSEEDQRIKLEIRDKLLEKFGQYPTPCNKNEAEAYLCESLCEIESDVNGWLYELGCDYGCEVSISREWFDTRDYGDFSFPAGEYTSLNIELGGGGGENFWCVMYPPMCRDAATGVALYTESESRLIYGGKYAVKFKLLELCASVAK